LPNSYIKRVFEAKNGDIYLTDVSTVGILSEGKLVVRYTPSAMPVALTEDAQGVVVSVVSNLFRVSRSQFVRILSRTARHPIRLDLQPGHRRDGSLWSPASMEFFG